MSSPLSPSFNPPSIPSFLIAEELDGIPFYYRGYKEVLNGNKSLEEILGSSVLQFVILQHIFRLLALHDPTEEKYMIGNNESGLHLGPGSNVGNDLSIFDIHTLTPDKIIGKYADVPPEVVVEVDIEVESIQMSPMDGAYLKTQKMLDFGVKKVIWIFTNSQKIMIAKPDQAWQTQDWNQEFILVEGLNINIAQYLKEKGVG